MTRDKRRDRRRGGNIGDPNSRPDNNHNRNNTSYFARHTKKRDRELFSFQARDPQCLRDPAGSLLRVIKANPSKIDDQLCRKCPTIEHQIIMLRSIIQLSPEDYDQRCIFTELFLDCLYRHHRVFYEGALFGSTVNGLGFRDSDIDLRLRPLKKISDGVYEPVQMDRDMIDRVLRDIAYQTTRCCPTYGAFVPSTRVPIAKLDFVDIKQSKPMESLKYDISISSTSGPFGQLNSRFLRFLCNLEPKFHLLATVLRYWSTVHDLIQPGVLSSYSLASMLIFFCQTIEPPLLPTINQMRDLELDRNSEEHELSDYRGLVQAEWNSILCFKIEYYTRSRNTEPLGVLLFKFFEFYLNFPYKTHLITTRPGKAFTFDEYKKSAQYHPGFPLREYLNIQDPFDFAHNTTSGMTGSHFRLLMLTMRYSYERMFYELLNNFTRPTKEDDNNRIWGLPRIFRKLTEKEKKFNLSDNEIDAIVKSTPGNVVTKG